MTFKEYVVAKQKIYGSCDLASENGVTDYKTFTDEWLGYFDSKRSQMLRNGAKLTPNEIKEMNQILKDMKIN